MPDTEYATRDQIIAEEEAIKESVYVHFDSLIGASNAAVAHAKNELDKGNYESQFISTYASEYDRQRQHQLSVVREISSLYKKPYFSHIKLAIPAENDMIHCLLTDCPELDESRRIDSDSDGDLYIIPFRQDAHRKLFSALFSAYQAKNGASFSVPAPYGEDTVYHPEIVREVTVESRVLQDVRQFYPDIVFEEETIEFDDILAKRLDENRESASLRNIIATLQREQYGIVQTPQDVSFVVQGCAGSGKSQCLIHRLFFLRSVINEKGWDKVLLITPSQLFRNYSAELMTRFRLKSVANTSISELYRELLYRIDNRFRNRQYRFELSEEYLPDEYLKQVYSQETIDTIRSEIKKAIRHHVNEACEYLNIPSPGEPLSLDEINILVEKLEREIASVRLRESERSRDAQYRQLRDEQSDLEKKVVSMRKTQARLRQRQSDLLAKKEQLEKLRDDIDYAERELSSWLTEIKAQQEGLRADVLSSVQRLGTASIHSSTLKTVNRYLIDAARYLDAVCEWGNKFGVDTEHTAFLRSYVELCQQELLSFSKGKSANALERSYQKDIDENEERLARLENDIALCEKQIEELVFQLTEYTNDENVRSQTEARIEAMEALRYYLSRIESSVFEREIWNALAPLKEKCGIKTLDVEVLENGHRKETRILYKSDLLFYLRIYMYLNELQRLPQYEYICVDEGQDLHKADYETLRELYPDAVFNVFGDRDQVLHIDCGIRDWQAETGIQKVFELSKNYRNTPAVVEFIRKRFNAGMEPCGKARKEQAPIILRRGAEVAEIVRSARSLAIIVKDRSAFETLCIAAGSEAAKLSYIDTNSEYEAANAVSCFSIFAAKGLEYPDVLVWPEGMTVNQEVVACSRALNRLYYFDQG